MPFPSKLKNMNLFVEGETYIGTVESVTLPKLTRKTEDYRGGGMSGSVSVDLGLDSGALDTTWSVGGYVKNLITQMGVVGMAGIGLRFTGAYQNDETGNVDAVEIHLRGRHTEIDRGDAKVGENTSHKIMTKCTYYKEMVNGETLVEIDVINMIEKFGDIDRLEEVRKAIGLA